MPDRALDPAHNLELFFGFILLDLRGRLLLLESYFTIISPLVSDPLPSGVCVERPICSSRGPFEGLLSLSILFSPSLSKCIWFLLRLSIAFRLSCLPLLSFNHDAFLPHLLTCITHVYFLVLHNLRLPTYVQETSETYKDHPRLFAILCYFKLLD